MTLEQLRERCAAVAENPGFIEARDSEWDQGVNYAKRYIAAAIRAIELPDAGGDMVLVPRVPTEAMITEGVGEWLGHGTKSLTSEWRRYIAQTYRAMVEAAPEPTAPVVETADRQPGMGWKLSEEAREQIEAIERGSSAKAIRQVQNMRLGNITERANTEDFSCLASDPDKCAFPKCSCATAPVVGEVSSEVDRLRAFYNVVNEMTHVWADTDRPSSIHPANGDDFDSIEDMHLWQRFVAARAALGKTGDGS